MVPGSDLAGGPRPSTVRLQEDRALAVQIRKGMRPRVKAANLIVNLAGRPRPVDDAVAFSILRRVGGLRLVLRRLRRATLGECVDRFDQRPRAELREIALDVRARFVLADRPRHLCDHRPGIERLDDAHDRDARLSFAGDDGAMNRRGAAILRQQRRMNVDEPEPRGLRARRPSGSFRTRPRRRDRHGRPAASRETPRRAAARAAAPAVRAVRRTA